MHAHLKYSEVLFSSSLCVTARESFEFCLAMLCAHVHLLSTVLFFSGISVGDDARLPCDKLLTAALEEITSLQAEIVRLQSLLLDTHRRWRSGATPVSKELGGLCVSCATKCSCRMVVSTSSGHQHVSASVCCCHTVASALWSHWVGCCRHRGACVVARVVVVVVVVVVVDQTAKQTPTAPTVLHLPRPFLLHPASPTHSSRRRGTKGNLTCARSLGFAPLII